MTIPQPDYRIPSQTRIGHIHLKVKDIERSLDFYCGMLGFEVTSRYGSRAAFISAGGYHHHIALNTWYSKNGKPPKANNTGLYHTAIVYPNRSDLAEILQRLLDAGYPLTGAADHGTSEALYLEDPDQNGVELYWDRPKNQWPYQPDGSVDIYSIPLDTDDLLSTLKATSVF